MPEPGFFGRIAKAVAPPHLRKPSHGEKLPSRFPRSWETSGRSTEQQDLHRVAALLRQGLNPNQITREPGLSKSKAYRLREQAERQCFAGTSS